MNRLSDIALTSLTGLFVAPLVAVAAGLILVTDGRPVLFRQVRVGRRGVPFKILKFRTMRASSVDGHFHPGDASRITKIGKVLRRTKIDELPQLLNVLRGDMSIVGPRPEVADFVDLGDPRWNEILSRRPGLTDWASVEFFDEERLLVGSDDPMRAYREVVLPRKLELQLRYVRQPNWRADFAILLGTVRRALKAR